MYGYRTDVGTLRPAKKMADGRLRADAHLARAGVYEYKDASYPGGIRRELRTPEEAFSRETLDSFAQVPVTNEHPPQMLDANTAKAYMVGSTGEIVTRDDDHMRAPLMVADKQTIAEMDAGKTEVSCGYSCDVDETPGVHPTFGRYDAIQRNIRGNHVAIVEKGRAGRTARVRMDAELTADERQTLATSSAASARRSDHVDRVSGGHMQDLDKLQETNRALNAQLTAASLRADTAEAALKKATERADSNDGTVDELKKKVTGLEAAIASGNAALETDAIKREKTRADSLQVQVNRFDEEIETRVRARCDTMTKAAIVMGPKFRMDDLADTQIQRQVLKRLDASIDVSDAVPAATIKAKFELRVDDHMRNAQSLANASEVLAEAHKKREDVAATAAPSPNEAWREPLPNSKAARAAGKVS